MLSCEFCEISKNTFFTEHLWASASVFLSSFSKIALLNAFLNEIPTLYFIRKCDICEVLEVWWEQMRIKILIL